MTTAFGFSRPLNSVVRIKGSNYGAFDPIPWRFVKANGRFDDPRKQLDPNFDDNERFQVYYCATQRVCALAEVGQQLQTDRTDTEMPLPPLSDCVTIDWCNGQAASWVDLDAKYVFVDLRQQKTINELNSVQALVAIAVALGQPDINAPLLLTKNRKLTQAAAAWVYAQVKSGALAGEPGTIVAGICYESCVATGQECWAIFDKLYKDEFVLRIEHFAPTDNDVCQAARILELTIEDPRGTCRDP